jgi:hypothetical protein
MTEHRVRLIGGENDEFGIFSTSEHHDRCHLTFTYRGLTLDAEADDFFEALCEIRVSLEKERLIPFCYGASLNVYLSGMSRDMGQGLKAYKLQAGKPALTKDLVLIFSEGSDVIPAYVTPQKEFFEEWLKGLGA